MKKFNKNLTSKRSSVFSATDAKSLEDENIEVSHVKKGKMDFNFAISYVVLTFLGDIQDMLFKGKTYEEDSTGEKIIRIPHHIKDVVEDGIENIKREEQNIKDQIARLAPKTNGESITSKVLNKDNKVLNPIFSAIGQGIDDLNSDQNSSKRKSYVNSQIKSGEDNNNDPRRVTFSGNKNNASGTDINNAIS